MGDVVVVGLPQLGAKLDMMFKDTAKKAIRKAATAGAEVFRRELRAKAPEREDGKPKGKKQRKPGYLKKHIGRSVKANSDGSLSVLVGPTKGAFYGKFVEEGHRNVRTKSEARAERYGAARRALIAAEFGGKDTPAHPFMRPAFDAKKDEAEHVFRETVWAEIQKELK